MALGVGLDRYQVDVHLDDDTLARTLAEDVRHGLTASRKLLPPKYFYDPAGSALFERITELPEYYPTRVEREIVLSLAKELMDEVRPDEVVELGAGSCTKIRWLFDARNGSSPGVLRFLPFDVDEETVYNASQGLIRDYSFLQVHGIIGDFERHLSRIPGPEGHRLVVFFGSTIGNLNATERRVLLMEMRSLLDKGDQLLLGVDLVKDTRVLEAAYNDSAGVTAEFNRNVLRVINRSLNADFRVDAFRHHALFNEEASRIEMHLVPESPQTVHLQDLDLTVQVSRDETIWTESSYKFTRESVIEMLEDAGLRLQSWHTDPDDFFAVALASPG